LVQSWVLTPDGFFLYFFSSDILSLDFREDSEFVFPSSASTEAEEECVARVHVTNQINWQLKAKSQ
jgi:hypothetical protein